MQINKRYLHQYPSWASYQHKGQEGHPLQETVHCIRGNCTTDPSVSSYQDASSSGKSVSSQVHKTLVTNDTPSKRCLDPLQSQLWFPRKIKLKSWWGMASVSSFPQEYPAPWEPSLLPLLWVRFLRLLSRVGLLPQTSSCGHTLRDTRRPAAGRMSPALCNLRF